MELVYTPNEAADLLKISYKHCLKLIRDGDLRAKKIGNKYRISKKDINTYIDSDADNFDLQEVLVLDNYGDFIAFSKDFYKKNPLIEFLNVTFGIDNKVKVAIPVGADYAKK